MKLSNHYRVQQLLKERERLRESLADTLGDEDIKITIRGREAQGAPRVRIREALQAMWEEDLRANTEGLASLGVEADDPPVMPTRKPEMVEARR